MYPVGGVWTMVGLDRMNAWRNVWTAGRRDREVGRHDEPEGEALARPGTAFHHILEHHMVSVAGETCGVVPELFQALDEGRDAPAHGTIGDRGGRDGHDLEFHT